MRHVWIVLLLLPGLTFGQIHVPSDHVSIQEALDAATSGDTVRVAAGTYYETVRWPDENGISLIGASSDSVFIEPSVDGVVFSQAGDVTIDSTTMLRSVTIQNGEGTAIILEDASPVIRDVKIDGYSGTSQTGILCLRSSAQVRGVVITGNRSESGQTALAVFDGAPVFDDLVVRNNEVTEGQSSYANIELYNSDVTIDGADISNNSAPAAVGGIYVSGGLVTIRNTNFSGNGLALVVENVDSPVDASSNWWGDETGPYHATRNPSGEGEDVQGEVEIKPFNSSRITTGLMPQPCTCLPLPDGYELLQNYPNPFNPSTTIPFELPEAAHVRITVHNALGQRVRVLLDRELAAGRRSVRFDAGGLPSGIYFVRMTAGEYRATRGVVLVE